MAQPRPFQQITIEYRVQGALDGSTPAPVISLDPSSEDFVAPNDQGIRVVDVPGNLGLIDPDLNGNAGSIGDRCIPWVYLDTNGLGGDPFQSGFGVLDNVPESGINVPALQDFSKQILGVALFYSDKPIFVPQGSVLGVVGYPAGSTKIVRVNIVAPQNALEYAELLKACCCLSTACLTRPDVDDVTPPAFTLGVETEFTLSGEELAAIIGIEDSPAGPTPTLENLSYALVQTNGEGGYIPAEVTSEPGFSSATIRIFGEDQQPGTFFEGDYTIVAFNPSEPECNNLEQALDTPVVLTATTAVCPTLTGITGDTSALEGSSGLVATLLGVNFEPIGGISAISIEPSVPGGPVVLGFGINLDGDIDLSWDAGSVVGDYTVTLTPTDTESCAVSSLPDAINVFTA